VIRSKSRLAYLTFGKMSKTGDFGLFGLCYAMNGGYRGCNPCIERHLAIFVNYFCLERTNQLSLLPDKDLVDLCSPIEPYQVTKSQILNMTQQFYKLTLSSAIALYQNGLISATALVYLYILIKLIPFFFIRVPHPLAPLPF
jgi:hypothetical protein